MLQLPPSLERLIPWKGKLAASLIVAMLGTAGLKAGYAAVGFVVAIVLARTLGPSGYGTYSFAMAVVAFLAIPSELGIPGLAVREIAVTNARKDWGQMRSFIRWAHRSTAVFAFSLIFLGLIALFALRDKLDPTKLQCLSLGLILVPIMSLGSLRGAMLRGLRLVVLGQLPEQIIRPAIFLALLLAFMVLGSVPRTASWVMVLQIAATSIAFAAGIYLFLRHRPPELSTIAPTSGSDSWLRSSLPFGMSAALRLINGRTDILVLGAFHAASEVGIYRVAVQLATFVAFGLQIVNPIQGPHLAHLYATGDMRRLQELVTQTSRGVLFVTLPVVLFMIAAGYFVIEKAFGHEYVSAYVPLLILCVGQFVNTSMGSVASVLNMTGHERDTAMSILVGAVVNIGLNFSLAPRFGMIGAAIATATTLIVWNMIMWRKVYQRVGIEASPFYRRRTPH